MRLLLDKLFFSVAFGHFTVDLLNGQRAVLFTYLIVPLGLGNTSLGFFTTLFIIMGSVFQPLFGYFADRYGSRWFAAGGIFWLGLFFTLAMLSQGIVALWLLVIGSLGSAAFHPAGTMQATLQGRDRYSGRETTAAAYFFVFGQAGLFLGPVLAGVILDRSGTTGLISLAVLAIPAGIFVARQLHLVNPSKESGNPGSSGRSINTMLRANLAGRLLPLTAFALLAAFQAWSQQNMMTFVPKHLSDLGQTASAYGLVAAIFMGGSALGNVVGGSLADRYGKRRVTAIALGLACIPLYLVSIVGWSPWLFLLIPLSGGLTGATHSIIVVLAQRMIPTGMAMASGMILGFMFASGAVGTFFSGYLADLFGVPLVFQLSALLALVAAGLALSLPKS